MIIKVFSEAKERNVLYLLFLLLVHIPTCFPSPGGPIRMPQEAERRRRQREESEERRRQREEINEKRQEIEQMNISIRKMERKARKDALKQEKRREKTLARLARKTEMARMKGHNIGIFGLTSTGKSTMVNSLLGNKFADIGVGETTRKRTPYYGQQYTLWDTPGRNDESTYSNQEYISFIKGLTRRLIVIQYTIKENSKLMRLLDDLGLGYDIVVNKFDHVDETEQPQLQRQIRHVIRSLGLKQMKKVFFLSAQYPKMFRDWLTMVDYLTEECLDCKLDFTKQFYQMFSY